MKTKDILLISGITILFLSFIWFVKKENFDSGLGSLTTNTFSGSETGYLMDSLPSGEMRESSSGLTGVSDLYGEPDEYGGYSAGMGLTW